MEKHPINDLMAVTMEKIREMVDANAIVGQPITTPDGVTLIPVSRMSFGFGSGGGDYNTKYTAGTGTGKMPCWQRTVPIPSHNTGTMTSVIPRLSRQTATDKISTMESTAPTS